MFRITSYTHLAQIIFVQPTAYKVSWEKSDPLKDELELYAIFPNDENGAVSSRYEKELIFLESVECLKT